MESWGGLEWRRRGGKESEVGEGGKEGEVGEGGKGSREGREEGWIGEEAW